MIDIGAVGLDVCSVIDIIILVHQTDCRNPVPDYLCVLSICVVGGVASESSTKIEEASVCNGVLVVVSGKIWVNLPP
jgi:hypothetical protein